MAIKRLDCDICWMWDDAVSSVNKATAFVRAPGHGPEKTNAGKLIPVCDACHDETVAGTVSYEIGYPEWCVQEIMAS